MKDERKKEGKKEKFEYQIKIKEIKIKFGKKHWKN